MIRSIIFFCLFLLFGNLLVAQQEKEPVKVIEKMPRFPGCEDREDDQERKKCSEELMLRFLYKNLEYPQSAIDQKLEGTVILQFHIDEKGEIISPKVIKDIGSGCAEAALNVLDIMPTWIPGYQRGVPAKVLMTLPVRFKLDAKYKNKPKGKLKNKSKGR